MASTREPARRPAGSAPVRSIRLSRPVALQALFALPWFAVSLILMSIIGTVPGYPWGWLVIALWLLSGAIVLVPSFERIVTTYVLRLREPAGPERERLMLTWRPVAHVGGVAESAYRIRVRRSPAPVLPGAPGDSLVVSDWAAGVLQPRQLEAVLARELGRHRKGSRLLSLLAYWYSVPARLVCGAVWGMLRGIDAVRRAIPFVGWAIAVFLLMCWLGVILGSLIRGDGPITFLWLFTPIVAPVLLTWWNRYAEKRADRATESLGYGAALAGAFQTWLGAAGGVGGPAMPRARLLDPQPSVPSRLRSLERFLDRRR
jgi:Zn-dependent protease with chaperone function